MIDCEILDDFTIKRLKKAGWKSGRKVNIAYWREQLAIEGYRIFPYAEEVLEELAWLKISSSIERPDYRYGISFDFDFVASGSGEADRLELYEPIVNDRIYPLGEVVQHFLHIGESKRIYVTSYADVYLVGNNIEECLNNLILGGYELIKFSDDE